MCVVWWSVVCDCYFASTQWVRCSAVAKSKTTMGGSDCLRGALCATFATLWIVERRRRWRLAKLDRTVGKKYLPHWLDFILMARFLYEHSFPAQFVWNQELYCKSIWNLKNYFVFYYYRELWIDVCSFSAKMLNIFLFGSKKCCCYLYC